MQLILESLAFLCGLAIGWTIHPFFMSKSQRWRTSPVGYVVRRISTGLIFGFIAAVLTEAYFNKQALGEDTRESQPAAGVTQMH